MKHATHSYRYRLKDVVKHASLSHQVKILDRFYETCLLITLAETDTMLHVCVQEVFQMESMVVYLGSDHVIKTPDFDFRKNSLRVSTTL